MVMERFIVKMSLIVALFFTSFLMLFETSFAMTKPYRPIPAFAEKSSPLLLDVEQHKVQSRERVFSFSLLQKMLSAEQFSKGNAIVSPVSIYSAFTILYPVSAGQTKKEFAKAFQFHELDESQLQLAYALSLRKLLTSDASISVKMANSLWVQKSFPIIPTFLTKNKTVNSAEIRNVDFTDVNTKDLINHWVSDKTNKLVPKLFDSLDSSAVMMIINTLYFKAKWQLPFKVESTFDQPFYYRGKEKNIPFMHSSAYINYLEKPTFQAISLPYGNGNLSMYVFLPKENGDLSDVIKQITDANWQRWKGQFRQIDLDLSMPKFTMANRVDFIPILKLLGVKQAFIKADFSKLTTSKVPLAISQVIQQSKINVNEEGTEAAAATAIEMIATAVMSRDPVTMSVNRPFFYTIYDSKSDTMLFMGVMNVPPTN